ncbi:unnamed protein product [Rotaria socialis]
MDMWLFLFDNKDDEVIETLNEIINKLLIVNNEDKLKKVLLLSYFDRIELFYKKEKFEDLVKDVNCLKKINYNIYTQVVEVRRETAGKRWKVETAFRSEIDGLFSYGFR